MDLFCFHAPGWGALQRLFLEAAGPRHMLRHERFVTESALSCCRGALDVLFQLFDKPCVVIASQLLILEVLWKI